MAFRSLLSAVKVVGGLTALSRLFGFLRDIIFAHLLGAGPAADAFLVAFKLPNLFRRLTAEGALTHAFLPAYSLAKEQKNPQHAIILATEVQAWLFLALSLIVLILELMMGDVIAVLAPGYGDGDMRAQAAILLAHITLPYLVMISLVGLWSAMCHAEDDYLGSGASPIILNLCLIAAALMIPLSQRYGGYEPVYMALPLAFAVPIAGLIQMAVMQQRLIALKRRPHFSFRPLSAEGRKMWRSFLPAALGAGGMQLNLIVDLILASWLAVGSLSWLYYADRLAQLPLGVIGIAIGTALLPRLSAAEAQQVSIEDKKQQFAALISDSFILSVIAVLPATAGLIMLAPELMAGLFVSGAFTADDGIQAAYALIAYGVGLPAFAFIKITQAGLYACGKARLVLWISLGCVVINLILSVILMQVFAHAGLALATSLSLWSGFLAQFWFLASARRMGWQWLKILPKTLAAITVMSALLYWLRHMEGLELLHDSVSMVILVLCGVILYTAMAVGMGLHHHLRRPEQGAQKQASQQTKTKRADRL